MPCYLMLGIFITFVCRRIYKGNLNTSTCGFSWISLQVHISSSLKGSMTAARSKTRLISLSILNSSIYDLNFVCAWCRAGGLCVFTITISSLPSSKLNTSASNFNQFPLFVWGSVKVQLCPYLNLDSLWPTRNPFSKYQHHPFPLIQRFVLGKKCLVEDNWSML